MGCGCISKESKIKTFDIDLNVDVTKVNHNESTIAYLNPLNIKETGDIFNIKESNIKNSNKPKKIHKEKKSEKNSKIYKYNPESILVKEYGSEKKDISGPIFNLLKATVEKHHSKKNKH